MPHWYLHPLSCAPPTHCTCVLLVEAVLDRLMQMQMSCNCTVMLTFLKSRFLGGKGGKWLCLAPTGPKDQLWHGSVILSLGHQPVHAVQQSIYCLLLH